MFVQCCNDMHTHMCMLNATVLQVHFLFLAWRSEGGVGGGTYSKGQVAERKNRLGTNDALSE